MCKPNETQAKLLCNMIPELDSMSINGVMYKTKDT